MKRNGKKKKRRTELQSEESFNPLAKKIPKLVQGPENLRPKQDPHLDPTTADFEDLLPSFAKAREEAHEVEETEQSRRYLGLLQSAYQAAQDAALATAQLEMQIVNEKTDQSGEVPDDFEADRFLSVQKKLLELRVLKDFGEAFGLGSYLNQIMATRIEALFGSHPVSITSPDGKAFYGTDEAYLNYRVKNSLKEK